MSGCTALVLWLFPPGGLEAGAREGRSVEEWTSFRKAALSCSEVANQASGLHHRYVLELRGFCVPCPFPRGSAGQSRRSALLPQNLTGD